MFYLAVRVIVLHRPGDWLAGYADWMAQLLTKEKTIDQILTLKLQPFNKAHTYTMAFSAAFIDERSIMQILCQQQ